MIEVLLERISLQLLVLTVLIACQSALLFVAIQVRR